MTGAALVAVASAPEPQYLADHPLLFAVPVLIPALVVVLLVAGVVIRDRRSPDPDSDPDGRSVDGALPEDGAEPPAG